MGIWETGEIPLHQHANRGRFRHHKRALNLYLPIVVALRRQLETGIANTTRKIVLKHAYHHIQCKGSKCPISLGKVSPGTLSIRFSQVKESKMILSVGYNLFNIKKKRLDRHSLVMVYSL